MWSWDIKESNAKSSFVWVCFFLKPGHKDLLKVFERVSTRLTSDMGNRINAAHKLISKLDLLIVLLLENFIPRHNWCSASWSYRSDFPTSLLYLTWYGYSLVWPPLSQDQPIPRSPLHHKGKRSLPGAPASAGLLSVTTLDGSQRPSPPLQIQGSEPDTLSILCSVICHVVRFQECASC